MPHLADGEFPHALLEQVRQAYRDCSGLRSDSFGILQEFVCESLCHLEVKNELSKDATTTAAGTAEKPRPRSVDPSPWKSDMHAEERYVPIEVIEEYRVEEEEPPEPAR